MDRYVVGLTGGIAAGKSAVARGFDRSGITTVDADVVAREVVAPGSEGLAEVVAHFGREVLTADGALDRAALRRRVFADPADRSALERIVHPRVRREMALQCAGASGPYVIAAIPLLAESGGRDAYPWLRRILVVDVPEVLQLARLVARDRIDEALARRMIDAQASRARRLALADDVLVNDGPPEALVEPIAALDALYRRLADGLASA